MRKATFDAREAGFTVLELSISVAILMLLMSTLVQALKSLRSGTQTAGIDSELQDEGERAIHSILEDLKPSGFATVSIAGVPTNFPATFLDGDAQGVFAVNAHPAATHHAAAGDPDAGPSREIAFLQPADADADGRPDVDAAGHLAWSMGQLAYVVVTRPDGVNVLQRRLNGVVRRSVAQHVERVVFDDSTTSGFVVPLRAIRVRVWLRQVGSGGEVHRQFTEAFVNLRNGGG